MSTRIAPTLTDIEAARARIEGIARVTPIAYSETFSRMAGREVQLKAENLQRTGAFKIRGAERAAGVVAASAGNHGQAVAWAAREAGVHATVFVPQDSPMAKVDATRNYGATVQFAGAAFEDAVAAAHEHAAATGAVFVHAFEDEAVIAGQGTIGLELADQLPGAESVVVPIGGGGLVSGIALALKGRRADVHVVGVQAERCAPLAGGSSFGFTIADGIA